MDKEYVYALIGIGGTLLGTFSGAIITILYERTRDRDRVKSELREVMNEVLFTEINGDLPVVLAKMRLLIARNYELFSENKALTEFFRKYLGDLPVIIGCSIANYSNSEEIGKMKEELYAIKL
ncbi:MAG: hypothetical protein ACOY33_09915 [Pseudomonadota bacterium]